jgi:hypothetical protein
MLVRDAPVSVDLAQAYRQPEQKTVLVEWTAGRVRSATHDSNDEGNVSTGRDCEFLEVEGSSRFVVTEEQIPRPFISFDAPALKRWRQIKHDDVRVMVSEDGRQVVSPDGVRPIFEKSFDPGFFNRSGFRHGSDFLSRLRKAVRSDEAGEFLVLVRDAERGDAVGSESTVQRPT